MRTILAIALFLAACADDEIAGVQVRMSFDGREALFFDAPFPSDHRLENGRVRVLDFPNPESIDLVERVKLVLDRDARGFGTTSGIFFTLTDSATAAELPDAFSSLVEDSPIFLAGVTPGSADYLARYPIELRYEPDAGPFGAPRMLSMLPVQGVPLRPTTSYAAVVLRRALQGSDGAPLGVGAEMRALLRGERPRGMSAGAFERYRAALEALEDGGTELDEIAGLAVFTTDEPMQALLQLREEVSRAPPSLQVQLTEVHDSFCVSTGTTAMPDFQSGRPPYAEDGGDWLFDEMGRPPSPRSAEARVVLTIPRAPEPHGGFPLVVFVRTGGGGDRPLVDRGARAEPGGEAIEPASGPARDFALAGWAAISVDGPHGGPRNPTRGDEQFLMFNIQNPPALRDNVRQSALELIVLARAVEGLTAPACPDGPPVRIDTSRLVLMGHSMGATIAPLAVAVEPRYRALILSGAGGSWIENVIHKESPIEVRPFAELLLHYDRIGRSLTAHDPVLSLIQWAGEPADPPAYARNVVRESESGPRHVLMFQGVVDTYILPPIANAASLSLGLDLAGPEEEPTLAPALALSGRRAIALPASGNVEGATAVVVQHREDGIEDGHEIVFQREEPKRQYRCFLETFARDGIPRVPADRCL